MGASRPPVVVDEAVLARLVVAEKARDGCVQQRWVFAILALTGLMCVYAMRVNLSVAVLPMRAQLGWSESVTGYILASFFVGYLPFQIPGGLIAKKWNAHAVFGLGVGATSLFTLLLPLAATGTLGGTGSVGLWGNVPIMLLRCLMGAGESVTFPALYALFQQWLPRDERSSIVSFVLAGSPLGTIISFPISSLLCSAMQSCPAVAPTTAPTAAPTNALLSGAVLAAGSDPDAANCTHCINEESVFGICSWSLVFYVFGALGCVWTVLWFSLTTNRPSDGRRCLVVSKEEAALIEYTNIALRAAASRSAAAVDDAPLEFNSAASGSVTSPAIEGTRSCCEGETARECCRTPWLALLTHPAAYAVYISHFSVNWAVYTFLTELPKFLKQRLDFDIQKAGVVEVLPYAAMFLTSLVGGKLCDALIRVLSAPRVAARLRACVPAPLARWTGALTPRRIARTLFQVSVLLFTVTFHANHAHNLTRSP
jgi:MFS family permease